MPIFFSGKEKEYFVENLSMLIGSGMGMVAALDSIKAEMRSDAMVKTIDSIKEDIENGSPLWRALDKSKLFAVYTISLIRIGEESGNLSENLKLIAQQEEKNRSLRSKIRSAMMYPLFVLFLTVVIGIGIAWFILPRLATAFSQLQLNLPLPTRILISSGLFLQNHGIVAIPIFLLVLFIFIYFIFFFSKTKWLGQNFLFQLPGIGKVIQEIELARFGYLLGSLIEAGMPVLTAIDSIRQATSSRNYQKLYGYLKENIDDGSSFQKSFSSYRSIRKLIPGPVQQIIVAGEQSGNLANSLLKIGEIFDKKTESSTKNLVVILEPLMLVIVWLGVVGVALAIIMPIYNLIGGLNK
jgi:type II secretory pathway component PulF